MVYYNIVFMSRSFRYPGAGVGGWASEGGWCGGYFWFGSTLRSNFLLLENCWRSSSFQYPYDPRIKEQDKVLFFLIILFKTPQPPPLDDKPHVDPSSMCTKTTLCCTYIGYAVLMTFSYHSNLPQVFHIFWTSTQDFSRHTHSCNIPNGQLGWRTHPTYNFDHKVNIIYDVFANFDIPTWLAKTESFCFERGWGWIS